MKADDLRKRIDSDYNGTMYRCKLFRLAENHEMITSDIEAYDFDRIVGSLCKREKLSSADALFVGRKNVLFIEFKTGFDTKNYNVKSETSRVFSELLRKSLRLKACESLIVLEKVLCNGDETDFNKIYVSVIDGRRDPLGARSEVLSKKAEQNNAVSEKQRIEEELRKKSILIYRRRVDNKNIMFDGVEVIYDTEFDVEISHIAV